MPTQPRRWVTWVPVVGLVVQMVRIRRGIRWLDTPAHRPPGVDPRAFLKREEAQLSVAVRVTGATLVGVILAMLLVLELLDGGH